MHPGDIVAGKYRVQRILGRSRGVLLEANHTEFDQRVVIRMLSPALCDEKEIERFRREARTLSKLESEHAARIIDVGTHSDGSFFLVRQYLEGVDLATHLRSHGAMRLDEAILFVLQACEAVQECHSHNIILRELQPAHLFLAQKRGGAPSVKIIDFGTAKILRDPNAMNLGTGEEATVMFGLCPYSSPELIRKTGAVDPRTDVWSMGCILYETLAAVPPFQGEMAELMLKITQHDPIPVSSLRPDLPRELDPIMGWALAKDPASRFSSIYALAHALKPFCSAEGHVLIDRIGRLAHSSGPAAHEGRAQISPTSPLAANRAQALHDLAEDDDSATVIRMAPSDEHDLERTAYMDAGAHAGAAGRRPSSVRPPSMGPGQQSPRTPPPPPKRPRTQSNMTAQPGSQIPGSMSPPAMMGAAPFGGMAMPPVAGSPVGVGGYNPMMGAMTPAPAQSATGTGNFASLPEPENGITGGGVVANATGGYPAQTATGRQTVVRQRKAAVVAIGLSLVLLPVLVMVGVFYAKRNKGETTALLDPPAASSTDLPAGDGTTTPDEKDPVPDETAEPVASNPPPTASEAVSPPPIASSSGKLVTPPPINTGTVDTPPRCGDRKVEGNEECDEGGNTDTCKACRKVEKIVKSDPVCGNGKVEGSEECDGGSGCTSACKKKEAVTSDKGKLMGIAIGGTCKFTVDGSSAGSGSSIRKEVSVGPHVVGCTDESGGTRTQRVTVAADRPGIASFRL